jgi:hypothetical protein
MLLKRVEMNVGGVDGLATGEAGRAEQLKMRRQVSWQKH